LEPYPNISYSGKGCGANDIDSYAGHLEREKSAWTSWSAWKSCSRVVGALYETFLAHEAHRILQRLEFHYTPKHASWLNMVEIEIGVLRSQCLDRRIGQR
jgi:hypothetical protein